MSQTQIAAKQKSSTSKRFSKGGGSKRKKKGTAPGAIIMEIPGEGRVAVSKNTFECNLYSVVAVPRKGQQMEITVVRHGVGYTVIGTCYEEGAWTVSRAFVKQ